MTEKIWEWRRYMGLAVARVGELWNIYNLWLDAIDCCTEGEWIFGEVRES